MKRILPRMLGAVAFIALGTACQVSGALSAGGAGDGTYQVGEDIQPGTYHTEGVGELCYADTKAASGSILNQEVQSGPVTFVIDAAAETFTSRGCGKWTESSKASPKNLSSFDDGSYRVGIDIEPGRYYTKGAGALCYADTTGASGRILDQEVQYGPVTFVISSQAEIFKSSHCGTWTKG